MKLVKLIDPRGEEAVGLVRKGEVTLLDTTTGQYQSLSDILEADDPAATARFLAHATGPRYTFDELQLLAPIDRQEVWAAGVTYLRSRSERMKESEGAAAFYSQVYEAQRPELFFKATPHRVVGPGAPVRIRRDATWNVPEPELTLVLNSRLQLVGFTIGNDMSSRDIEGENPLYLPQAKVYDDCCALGPAITLVDRMPSLHETTIELVIRRGEQVAFEGRITVDKMKRSFEELIGFLGRDNSFPSGVFLMTGTGIVPTEEFTLAPGDVIDISISGIGKLTNPVVQG